MSNEAFVTLATTDDYALGALVLAHSLRRMGTNRKIAVIITEQVSQLIKEQLQRVFDEVKEVDPLDSGDKEHLAILGRPELGPTLTKMHIWTLTNYSKCVFLDADTLVLQNIDELFLREELSACYDVGWPDCFNSGVFVFRPSRDTFGALIQLAVTKGSFDGADQGLLNAFFSDWATKDISKHLPFVYNCVHQSFYSYMPAFQHFYSNIKVVHFIGPVKPWHHTFDAATGHVQLAPGAQHHPAFVQLWWALCLQHVQAQLAAATQPGALTAPADLRGSAAQLARLLVTAEHRVAWSVDAALSNLKTFTPTVGGSRVPPPAPLPGAFSGRPHVPGGYAGAGAGWTATESGEAAHFASSAEKYQAWREGRVDYMGDQAFAHLESHMKQLATPSAAQAAEPQVALQKKAPTQAAAAEPQVAVQKKAPTQAAAAEPQVALQKKAPTQAAQQAPAHGHGHEQEPHRHPHPYTPAQQKPEVKLGSGAAAQPKKK